MSSFSNEVFVNQNDEEELVGLLSRANDILEKYPYALIGTNAHTVTAISRAKNFVADALKWCKYLYMIAESINKGG